MKETTEKRKEKKDGSKVEVYISAHAHTPKCETKLCDWYFLRGELSWLALTRE